MSESWLASLDTYLAAIDRATPVADFVAAWQPGPYRPDAHAKIAANDELFRRVLRTAYVTQSFRDLAPETQVAPVVQERMASHMDEIDDSVLALTEFLAGQTAAERRQLRDVVREHPDLAMHVGEEIERAAERAGVPEARRRQLRAMMVQLTFRLKTEDPSDIIDEYTAKVRRLSGDAHAAAFATALGTLARKKYERYFAAAGEGGDGGGNDSAPLVPVPDAPLEKQPRGGKAMRVGGIMMGVGTITFAAGAMIVDAGSDAGLFIGTAGVVLGGIGLLTLLVGAVMYVVTKPKPEDPIPKATARQLKE